MKNHELKPKELQEVNKWVKFYEQFWDNSIDNLDNYLNKS